MHSLYWLYFPFTFTLRSTLPSDVSLTRGRFGWWSFSWLFCAGNIEWSLVYPIHHTPFLFFQFLLHYMSRWCSFVLFGYYLSFPSVLHLPLLWTNWITIWLKNPVKSQTFTWEMIVCMSTTIWYSLPNGFGHTYPIVLLPLSFSISLFQSPLPPLSLLLSHSTFYLLALASIYTFLFTNSLLRLPWTTIWLKNPVMFHWDICLGDDSKLIPLGDALSIGLLVIVIIGILFYQLSLVSYFYLLVFTF